MWIHLGLYAKTAYGLVKAVIAAQMTNSCSPPPPKTSANWPRSFPHRSNRAKPDKKGTRPQF